jgi:hypothetical protein
MEQLLRRTSSNLSGCKERRKLTNNLPLVDTNGSVKKLTLFLPGLALLQSSRIKFSVARLEIFRPDTRHCRTWRTSTTFPKTSHPCNVSKSAYKICTSKLNVNSSTTLRLPHRLPSISTEARVKQMKESATMANHDPRMKRTNPKYRALLGIVGTWSTSCDFCNCLLFALCVLDSVCSCLECFLSVYCYLMLVLVFGLLALKKTPLVCKRTLVRKPLYTMCSPLSIYVSMSSIDKLKTRKLTLTLIMVGSNSPRVSTWKFCYMLPASSRPLYNVKEAEDRLARTTKDF